jgi:hypothetical protein
MHYGIPELTVFWLFKIIYNSMVFLQKLTDNVSRNFQKFLALED